MREIAHSYDSTAKEVSMSKYKIYSILAIVFILFFVWVNQAYSNIPQTDETPRESLIQHSQDVLEPREYAKEQVIEHFGIEHWKSFDLIIKKESGWKHTAQNPTSTAFGIAQFLNSTWQTVGCEKTDDPYIQIDCAIKYIEARYENPQVAWNFHIVNNYY